MTTLGDIGTYILILFGLVTASGFFSGTEVAMFSLRRVDREQMARSTRRTDTLVARLLARPRRLIATLLLGNELVNVSVSAVIAGMAPLLYPGRDEVTLALLATFTALPILLLLGEITPKTIAIKTAASWSRNASRPLWLFGLVVTPLRMLVLAAADLLLWPFGGSTRQGMLRDLSEEEFRRLVDAGNAEGEVDAREQRFIHSVFEFGDKTVAEVMEPRDRIFALSARLSFPQLMREVVARGFSRVPIYDRGLHQIRGILHAKDLLIESIRPASERRPLGGFLHEPLYVPPSLKLETLFRDFKQRKSHMALVVDEHGRLVGLITMEDLLEELFGEIRDEREFQKARPRQPVVTDRFPVSARARASEPAGARERGVVDAHAQPALEQGDVS
ncbi:MAG: hemolysin family protein [Haliangiales bacterium]